MYIICTGNGYQLGVCGFVGATIPSALASWLLITRLKVDTIQPFTPEVQAEFQRWVRRPEHTNRARTIPKKYRLLIIFFTYPRVKVKTEQQTWSRHPNSSTRLSIRHRSNQQYLMQIAWQWTHRGSKSHFRRYCIQYHNWSSLPTCTSGKE